MIDEFQKRYVEHQDRKKEMIKTNIGDDKRLHNHMDYLTLLDIMTDRRSQRTFTNRPIVEELYKDILESVRIAPSSCNRQAIYIKEVDKEYAERTLVGGKNWINGADKVILLFGGKTAYKSPNEVNFMPFLDAGFVGQNIYLMSEVLGIGACFVNPNIREENKQEFIEKFGDDYFCGAFALGNYSVKSKRPPLKKKVIK